MHDGHSYDQELIDVRRAKIFLTNYCGNSCDFFKAPRYRTDGCCYNGILYFDLDVYRFVESSFAICDFNQFVLTFYKDTPKYYKSTLNYQSTQYETLNQIIIQIQHQALISTNACSQQDQQSTKQPGLVSLGLYSIDQQGGSRGKLVGFRN